MRPFMPGERERFGGGAAVIGANRRYELLSSKRTHPLAETEIAQDCFNPAVDNF